jgi:hypothetical protein
LDKEVHAKKGVPAFGFCLKRFTKKEISRIEEKDLFPFLFDLGDQCRFLGDTAKRIPKSTTGFDLTHYIVGVGNAELSFGRTLDNWGESQV